jgi:hypothetical protein
MENDEVRLISRASAMRVPLTLAEAKAAEGLAVSKILSLQETVAASGSRPGRLAMALARWQEKRAEAAYWVARLEAGETLDPTGEIQSLRQEVLRLEAEIRVADSKRAEAERKSRPPSPEHVQSMQQQIAGLTRTNRMLRQHIEELMASLNEARR